MLKFFWLCFVIHLCFLFHTPHKVGWLTLDVWGQGPRVGGLKGRVVMG